ncbi:MAG: hypothetical protein ACFFAV_16035, partial [Candidatus Hermodarchaeota archaeon]
MKNLNNKALMLVTIFLCSVFGIPVLAVGQENDIGDSFNFDQVNIGIFDGFRGGFGALFSDHLGYGGQILGSIFEALFLNDFNLSKFEMLGNTFVISVNRTYHERGTYNFDVESNTRDIYPFPQGYLNLTSNEALTGLNQTEMGHAYCVVDKHGEFNYNIEVGVAVTLIIWDNDRSFITAVNKLLTFFRRLISLQSEGLSINQDLIREGISKLTWFLIHINDIITGDELFIMNPITWQKLDIAPGSGFSIDKSWYFTGQDLTPADDLNIMTEVTNGDLLLDDWNTTAQQRKDSYTEWLLTPTHGNVA